MKFFSITRQPAAIIVAAALFIIMPLLWSRYMPDMDSGYRFLGLAGIMLFISGYFLFADNSDTNRNLKALFRSGIFLSFAAYVTVTTASLIFSLNKGEATFELIKYLLYFLLFISMFRLFYKNQEHRNLIIFSILISSLIFSAAGLWQLFPGVYDYLKYGKEILINYSLSSTLSNKNFFAETMLLCFPFSVYGIIFFRKAARMLAVVSLVGCLFFIFILQSLSVWIAFISASAATGIFLLWRNRELKMKLIFPKLSNKLKVLVVAGMAVFIAAIAFAYLNSSNGRVLKQRIKTSFDYLAGRSVIKEADMVNNNSTFERMVLWRNSWRMIKEFPFGAGINNWKIYFPKYGVSGAPFMNYGSIRFEYPHNDFLFIWCEKGFLGLIFYLMIFIAAFYTIVRRFPDLQSDEEKWLAVFLFFGLISFLIISFFGFPNQRIFSSILLMVILAFTASLHLKPEKQVSKKYFPAVAIFLTGIIIGTMGLSIGVKRLKSEKHLANAFVAQKRKDWGRMVRELEVVNEHWLPMDYASTPVAWYSGFACYHYGNRQKAFEKFRQAERVNPYHVQVLNDLGTCLQQENKLSTAENYFRKALSVSPYYPDVLVNMAVMKFNENKFDSAFIFVSKYCTGRDSNYWRVLKAVLKANAETIIHSTDKTYAGCRDSIPDENRLIEIFEKSDKSIQNYQKLILEASNKNHIKI